MDAPRSRHPDLYAPLPTATSMRVIELHPVQSDDEPIECTLHLTDLEHNTFEFHALSYTWGDPLYRYWFEKETPTTWVQEVTIKCNELDIDVTANLKHALRAIRMLPVNSQKPKYQVQYLWIVHFMKIALEEDDKTEIDTISAEEFESLTRFLARKYFFRCWVLQEVMLARHIRMLCGTDILDFSELQRVALLVAWIKQHRFHETVGQALTLPMRNNRHYDHENAILELFHNRWRLLNPPTTQEKTLPFTFAQLLTLARMTECKNPEDKVFALLGIVPRGAFGITADYSKSPEQVYIEALRCLIDETKNLNCLSWVTDLSVRKFPRFPTWVGELEDKAFQSELASANVGYNATLGSRLDTSRIVPTDSRVLGARGLEIDRIVELAGSWEWHGKRLQFDPRWSALTLNLPKLYQSTGQTRCEALTTTLVANDIGHLPLNHQPDMDRFKHVVKRLTGASVVRCLHRLLYYPDNEETTTGYEDTASPILRDIDILSEGDDSGFATSRADVRHTEQQSCTCGANLTQMDISRTYPRRPPFNPKCPYIVDFRRPDPTSHPYLSSISDRIARLGPTASEAEIERDWQDHNFGGAINRNGQFRRLARTKNGLLGLVPTSCEAGDAVWLLQGANVPCVLRESNRHISDGYTRRIWEVMGDAYVHGAMQGEVWRDVKDQLVDIELV
ncbi:hypothetical protein J4E91_004469 [Alternaria rosae]|nr:hypothetical protein J4E91_004469 [Alternaria rosae]